MGKVRVASFDEEGNKKVEAKKMSGEARSGSARQKKSTDDSLQTTAEPIAVDSSPKAVGTTKKKRTVKKKETSSKKSRSDKYLEVRAKVDANKKYRLAEALDVLPSLKVAKFDETVELHINTTEPGISGTVVLPHGTGKQIRVAIADDDVIAEIVKGKINFDVLVATPQTMPKLAKVAKVLGPRGLMPNPKNGTVSQNPEDVVKKFQGGQIGFKTEAKLPVLHVAVGKVSFGKEKLTENINTMLSAVNKDKVKKITLKSTMSPAIKLDTASL